MTLTEFVTARLDEWERLARNAHPHETGSRDIGQPPDWVTWRRSAGSAEFGLRHVATLRAILAAYQPNGQGSAYVLEAGLEFALGQLAAVWSGHPDYDPDWA
jgi:hypothetical protein